MMIESVLSRSLRLMFASSLALGMHAAQAQNLAGDAAPAADGAGGEMQKVEVTGSSIKRLSSQTALPITSIKAEDFIKQGLTTAQEVMNTIPMNQSSTGSSQSVGSGTGGMSSADLRGLGSDKTLVLLNGRRIASHPFNGAAVDLNIIPLSALDRVEVLRDGASAIYGTDAIGGVINFILKKNYRGLETQAFVDVTEAGGSEIGRASVTGGWGDLQVDGWNVLATFAHSQNKALRGDQRDFVNTFQPDRGVSVDTRGSPSANVFATTLAPTLLSRTGTGPTLPGGGTTTYNGISLLDLPGGAGCNSIDGMGPYDEKLWNSAGSAYGCAWDTGRAAVLQQPVKNSNALARATFQSGDHQFFIEGVASNVEVSKRFSPNQISPSASTFGATSFYPRTGAAYDSVYNALVKQFPGISAN